LHNLQIATLGNTDKIAISNGSCQQLTAKNKGVRIIEAGHAEDGDEKKEKFRNHNCLEDQKFAKI
jgi:hypothetical protein